MHRPQGQHRMVKRLWLSNSTQATVTQATITKAQTQVQSQIVLGVRQQIIKCGARSAMPGDLCILKGHSFPLSRVFQTCFRVPPHQKYRPSLISIKKI
jgi:hypothetical protein